jgi:hypothetical protein
MKTMRQTGWDKKMKQWEVRPIIKLLLLIYLLCLQVHIVNTFYFIFISKNYMHFQFIWKWATCRILQDQTWFLGSCVVQHQTTQSFKYFMLDIHSEKPKARKFVWNGLFVWYCGVLCRVFFPKQLLVLVF